MTRPAYKLRASHHVRNRTESGDWVDPGGSPRRALSPAVGSIGAYPDVSRLAVKLNQKQEDEGRYDWVYYPDPVPGVAPVSH
ncbi:hypothetical protein [Agromyces sp. NPDC058104]|uniref:hypothetical protein n=1 Tax=Agromyces sp. NPDC058104 TaxID=3346342 RepID=UPI0036DC6DC0